MQAKLSQEQVAELLSPTAGLSAQDAARQHQQMQRLISRWETGDTRLDVLQLWLLCRAIDLPFSDFMKELDEDFQTLLSVPDNMGARHQSTPKTGVAKKDRKR